MNENDVIWRPAVLTPSLKLEHWGPGDWVDEPDRFEFEHEGFSCCGFRVWDWEGWEFDNLALGHWCGYILIPKEHPWYGRDVFKDYADMDVDVHGGLTHGKLDHPKEGGWWIGFDCAHSWDLVPSMINMKKKMIEDMKLTLPEKCHNSPIFMDSYKNFDYVVNEVKSLAEQAKRAGNRLMVGCDEKD